MGAARSLYGPGYDGEGIRVYVWLAGGFNANVAYDGITDFASGNVVAMGCLAEAWWSDNWVLCYVKFAFEFVLVRCL